MSDQNEEVILNAETNTALTLASLTETQIAPASMDENDFKEMAVTRNFLPRINLLQALSKEVTKKKLPSGEFIFTVGKDDITKMGEKFTCIPLAFRFKAVDMRNKEKILNYYDQKSPEFLNVKKISKESSMSGCLCGIEFLLWVPEREAYATYYLSSTSALAEAQNIRNLIGKPTWLKSKQVETEKYSWYVPVSLFCSDPTNEPSDLALAKETINTFLNPKSSDVEIVTPEDGKDEGDRAR